MVLEQGQPSSSMAGTENPELNPHTYGHVIVDKDAKTIQWEKTPFSWNTAALSGGQHVVECKFVHSLFFSNGDIFNINDLVKSLNH